MRSFHCFQVDAFTRTKFSGNPAGIVLEADSLSEREMHRIAREFNNSEIAFVLKARSDDHDVHIRFFTPSCEVPSCGHATIAAHYVRTAVAGVAPGRVRQLCGAGILNIETERDCNARVRINMHQSRPQFSGIGAENRSAILSGLAISPEELNPDKHEPCNRRQWIFCFHVATRRWTVLGRSAHVRACDRHQGRSRNGKWQWTLGSVPS